MIKIYNDDCIKIMQQMEDNSIDCIVTDPPYGVNFQGADYLDDKKMVLNNMKKWYKQWGRILKNNCYLYIFCGVKNIQHWIEQGVKTGFEFKNIIATRSFNNGSPTPKNNFAFLFQPVLVFSKGKGKSFNEINFVPTSKEWYEDKRNKKPKPYTYVYPNWINTNLSFATEKRATKNFHPNEKSIKLIKFLIEISTKPNDTVLDSFLGGGSTALACVNSGRNCIGIEITKKYYEIAKERLGLFGVENV